MRLKCVLSIALFAGSMMIGAPVPAQQTRADTQIVVETRADKILEQQAQIRAEVAAKQGRYAELDRRALDRLKKEQDTVFALLEGRASSNELDRENQLMLFNSLEAISAIINQAEDERMVCRRVRRTGSNMSETVCKTVAQRREEREHARETLPARHALSCGHACP